MNVLKVIKIKNYAIYAVFAVYSVLIFVKHPDFFAQNIVWIPLVIISSVGFYVSMKFGRCPQCNNHLGEMVKRYCTHCGCDLQNR